ncbi:MAG: hypothetical protein AAGU05_16485, partial [Anaerolineaceae bacterium]
MSKKFYTTESNDELAILVGVDLRTENQLLTLEDSLEELSLLADTAGLEIVGETYQKLERPNPETLIGGGKVEEIRILLDETGAKVCVFDTELNPRHQRELENKLGDNVKVLDRT